MGMESMYDVIVTGEPHEGMAFTHYTLPGFHGPSRLFITFLAMPWSLTVHKPDKSRILIVVHDIQATVILL